MNNWIWLGIAVVVIIIIWFSLRSGKKEDYGRPSSSGGLWNSVKDACCSRRKR